MTICQITYVYDLQCRTQQYEIRDSHPECDATAKLCQILHDCSIYMEITPQQKK